MNSEKPSRFHKSETRKDDDDQTGKYFTHWVLDRTHPELESTLYCDIAGAKYCAYCGKRCGEIQAGYGLAIKQGRNPSGHDYDTTGWTCDCQKARREREKNDKQAELGNKIREMLAELDKEFADLVPDKKVLLEIKHRIEKDRIERGVFNSGILTFSKDPAPYRRLPEDGDY